MLTLRHGLAPDLDFDGEAKVIGQVGETIEFRDRCADFGGKLARVDGGWDRHAAILRVPALNSPEARWASRPRLQIGRNRTETGPARLRRIGPLISARCAVVRLALAAIRALGFKRPLQLVSAADFAIRRFGRKPFGSETADPAIAALRLSGDTQDP